MSPLRSLWPFAEAASGQAQAVEYLAFALFLVCGFGALLTCGLAVLFALRYREGAAGSRAPVGESVVLQALWITAPVVVVLATFAWAAAIRRDASVSAGEPLEIEALAKQWAWKFRHPDGRQEINELHVPRGRPVRLRLLTEDVGHALLVPALRLNQQIRFGHRSEVRFQVARADAYRMFCADYCGAACARMSGQLVVMDPRDYEQWLSGVAPGETPVSLGARLFTELRCDTCHRPDGAGRGPSLEGIFGRTVTLRDGRTLIADEAYLRESILEPGVKIVSAYEPVMPAFEGRLSAEQLNGLLAYLRSLERGPGP